MRDAPQEIKSRLTITDLVSQYVQLKKAGRNLKGLCPFHAEKSPSFIVSPDKGIAYCFGCHKGGDVFFFLQEMEGVDFVDALKILAERTGVKLEEYHTEKRISKSEKDELLRIHELATEFYEHQLRETPDGAKVLEYLHRRGIHDESIRTFRLGFSPDSYEALYPVLLKEGFTKRMLVSAGVAMSQDTSAEKIYDRFRGRLMFPIFDSMGRIVAFGGRALQKEQEPKYLNSPETVLYQKSHILYGFSHAKSSLKQQQSALVVEGYMDMIAAHQAGVANTVASSGTALTVKQLRLLQPFIQTLYLAFDMDDAGQAAAHRAYELTRDFDFHVKMVQLPEGKDIAEYAKSHVAELQNVLQQAFEYAEYFYQHTLSIYGKETFSEKRKILQEFYPFFFRLKSRIEKDHFIRKLAKDLDLTELQIYDEMKNFKLPLSHPARLHSSLEKNSAPLKKYQPDELLLGFMMEFLRLAILFKDMITEELFSDGLKAIYKAYTHYYNEPRVEEANPDHFFASLPHDLAEKAAILSLYIAEVYGEMSEEAVEKEMKVLIDKIKKSILNNQRKEILQKIRQAEEQNNKKLREELLKQLDQFVS